MKTTPTMPKIALGIDYLEGTFNKEDLDDIENYLNKKSISLYASSHHPKQIMGIEDLFPQIGIMLSPDIVHNICMNLLSCALYDAIKQTLCYIWKKIKLKKITKIKGSEIISNVTPNAHFIVGRKHIVLPTDIDEEKFKYFVDKFFESIDTDSIMKETYTYYNSTTNSPVTYTKDQIAQKGYLEWYAQQESTVKNEGDK